MFRELEGDTAIIVENGIYKAGALYEHNGYLFVKINGGYVKVYENGATSKITHGKNSGGQVLDSLQIDTNRPLYRDPQGRVMVNRVNDKVTLLSPAATAKLLELPAPEKTNGND